jgi:aerobic-type carbon monoxide dehydrogenase small subunit (CoxS/CutS family)
MIMGALGWLRARTAAGNSTLPSDDEIRDFLSGGPVSGDPVAAAPTQYLCRCGTHMRIVRAISAAAGEMS